jgi:release factor glutamine methyltransferase
VNESGLALALSALQPCPRTHSQLRESLLTVMSLGGVRRAVHPLLMKLWMRHSRDKVITTQIDGLTLKVLPTVFHPRFFGSSRIFAEYLVTIGLEGKRFLDLGTGSGIVGLHAARAGAIVTALDINPKAVECAQLNATCAGLVLDCRGSDLFSALTSERFDIIAWNPPFFPKEINSPGEAAFYAGEDYEVIRRFACAAPSYLTSTGRIFLILSSDLDFSKWEDVFGGAGLRLEVREERRWGWETMSIIEVD